MAKDKNNTDVKDLGTVKEVYCSGVAITSTGAKIFMANVSKGDRIVEEGGKKKISPKVDTKSNESKPAKQSEKKQTLATQTSKNDFLEGGENDQNNGNNSPENSDGENLPNRGE